MARERAEFNQKNEPRTSPASSEEISARTIDLEDQPEEQFLRTERRVAVRRGVLPRKAEKRLQKLAMFLCAAALFAGASVAAYSYSIHSWRFRLDSSDNIEISGVKNSSRAQVMEVARADIGRNIFFVPLEDRRKQLEQIPWVESASVMRLLPNRLAISIRERTPVAFVQVGSHISLIDAHGVILGLPANRQSQYSFPVIRGIAETEPLSSRTAAMKIYNHFIQELDSEGGAQYSAQLSEVDLSDPEDIKITTNDPAGAVLVHLGSSDFLTRYKWYLANIADWRQKYVNLQSVDLRYEGQIVINPETTHAGGTAVPAANGKRRP